MAKRAVKKVDPEILIFDVDGVLIDVKETFWRSALQTMEKLTGKKATWADVMGEVWEAQKRVKPSEVQPNPVLAERARRRR